MTHNNNLSAAETIVIKLGTRLLTDEKGTLNLQYMEKLTEAVSAVKKRGKKLLIVSSGAIGAGVGRMKMSRRPVSIPEKQAAAAVGQGMLIQYYENYFRKHGLVAAQVLLTRDDLCDRKKYINASNTLWTLLKWDVIPIVNENDTVAVDEIRFGDNDHLSALVAALTDTDLLVIMTDTQGLYTENPIDNPGAELIDIVEEITPEIKQCAGNSAHDLATGGMITKIQAAEMAVNAGISVIITSGRNPANLIRITEGEHRGTLFPAGRHHLKQRKRWIALGMVRRGVLQVDKGARQAVVSEGKSLLPIGVTQVEGSFAPGDLVTVTDDEGREFARGISGYSSAELLKIIRLPSSKIPAVLGYFAGEEVIHRDNMVITV